MMCHYGKTLLCLKLPQRFSCEMWQNKVFIRLQYIYIDLGFTVLQLLSPLKMAEYQQQQNPMMHSDTNPIQACLACPVHFVIAVWLQHRLITC